MPQPNILFIEDNDSLRTVLVETLKRQGYRVVEATTAEAALQLLRVSSAFDLLIIDLGIPGRGDRALIAENRRYAAGIPKLYISGYPLVDAQRLYEFPPDAAFLPKPFGVAEFLDKVRVLLASPLQSK